MSQPSKENNQNEKTASSPTGKAKKENTYSAYDFAAGGQALFGVHPDCVAAALAEAGIKEGTKAEVESTILTFANKIIQ